MKIALFGASGHIGQRVLQEALNRGHTVTGIARHPENIKFSNSNLKAVISPAAFIEPGKRTGTFRLGTDQLVVDAQGKSAISMEDFAVALVNEVEKPQFSRRRFTVAY